MKRIIKYLSILIIVIYGMVLLITNWPVYKDFFSEIFDKVYRSDFERSLAQENSKIKNEPANPWNYIYRGETYKKNKMYNESLEDFLKAYELKSSFFIVLDDISNVYLALGNTSKAYEYIIKMMKIAPYPEKSLFDLAIIYDYEMKSKEALDTYTKFIEQNNMEEVLGKYIFSLKRRSVHYILLKEYDKAKRDIDVLQKVDPDDKEVVQIESLLSDSSNPSSPVIQKKFKLNVHDAIVGTEK